jgi:hypothetical protein
MHRQPTDPPFLRSVQLKRELVESFDVFPFNIPAVKHLGTLELHRNVTFFVGENGTGKSTLLEAMAVAEGFNPEGGSRHAMFSTQATHDETLPRKLQLGKNMIPRGARSVSTSSSNSAWPCTTITIRTTYFRIARGERERLPRVPRRRISSKAAA